MFHRLRSRELTPHDIAKLDAWIQTNPEVPEGLWCKDFGSFKLAGEGKYPKTFLTKGQPTRQVHCAARTRTNTIEVTRHIRLDLNPPQPAAFVSMGRLGFKQSERIFVLNQQLDLLFDQIAQCREVAIERLL